MSIYSSQREIEIEGLLPEKMNKKNNVKHLSKLFPIEVITDFSQRHCLLPLVIDSYGTPCSFACKYCYAHSCLVYSLGQNDFENLNEHLNKAFTLNDLTAPYDLLRQKIPIRLGYLTDPFPEKEQMEKLTLKLLKIFFQYQYPIQIFTKSDIINSEEYTPYLQNNWTTVQMTITSASDLLIKKLEPGAPSASQRLKAMKDLVDKKVRVIARINPLLENISTENGVESYYTDELINKIIESGVKEIIIGGLNPHSSFKSCCLNPLTLEKINKISGAKGVNLSFCPISGLRSQNVLNICHSCFKNSKSPMGFSNLLKCQNRNWVVKQQLFLANYILRKCENSN